MSWVVSEFSNKAIARAGNNILDDDYWDLNGLIEAYHILTVWRASHAYPMHSMLGYFRKVALSVNSGAIIAQRLKRTPSIVAKLKRENGMMLNRMEDIGGCRIVVDNKKDVYFVRDSIINGRTRNILKRERDYIKRPKESGYRGIHLVYQYNGQKIAYRKHMVELQIRSKIQHSWATAVEVVGTFTGQALKASEGYDLWLTFFKLASIAFEDIENRKINTNAKTPEREELVRLAVALNVIPRLRAFAVSSQHLERSDKQNKGVYFLLTLKIDESNINIRRFKSNDLEAATEEYSNLEKEFEKNKNRDVVLVSAQSIRGLKKAYPNYFADTTDFVKNMERILSIK